MNRALLVPLSLIACFFLVGFVHPANATICNITCTRGMDGDTTSCFDFFNWESECAEAANDQNHGDVACKYDWSYLGSCVGASRVPPASLVKRYLCTKVRGRACAKRH